MFEFQFKSVEVMYNREKKAFKSSLVDDEDNIGAWRSVRRTVIFQQWSSESERSRHFALNENKKGISGAHQQATQLISTVSNTRGQRK